MNHELATAKRELAAHRRTCKTATDILDPHVAHAIRESVRLQLRIFELQKGAA
jgi:hypothetical protein